PFRLVDTAGLRDTNDLVEGMGVEVAQRYLQAADIVVYCLEVGASLHESEHDFLRERDPERTVLVTTKDDLRAGASVQPSPTTHARIAVSARQGSGLAALSAEVVRMAFGAIDREGLDQPLLTRRRHVVAFERARQDLRNF